MIAINLIVIFLLLFANGFFVASEFGLVSVRQTKMTQLQILTQFSQLFIDSKIAVDCYNNNVRNELIEKDPDDTFQQAYNKFVESIKH